MGKIINTTVSRFEGGVSNDPRNPAENVSRMVSNFDILTDPRRMIPYRSGTSGNTTQNNNAIRNYAVGFKDASNTPALYGLGVVTGTTRPQVFYKDITASGTNDLADANWTTTANNSSASTGIVYDLFVYYKQTGLFYGAYSGNLWTYNPVTPAWTDAARTFSFTNMGQGIVASDNILYIPYDNLILTNNNGTWNNTAFTAPAHLRIRMLVEYGNYIAVACEPLSGATPGFGGSIVFLWDKTSTSWNELIYWGDDRLLNIGVTNGSLVGISITTGASRFDQKVTFRTLVGSSAIKILELVASSTSPSTDMDAFTRNSNNRLYFWMAINIDGVNRNGIWSIGGTPGNFTLIHERTTNNDSTFTALLLKAFHFIGDYLFISYTDTVASVTTEYMVKTNSATSYTATSIYEKLFNLGDSSINKKLRGVTVMTEPLPSGGQIVLKYKKDKESAFTTIFTNTTVASGSFVAGTTYTIISLGTTDFTAIGASANTVGVVFVASGVGTGTGVGARFPESHSSVNIEGTGATLPEYKEITLRIESTGGAVPIGLSFNSEIIDKNTF